MQVLVPNAQHHALAPARDLALDPITFEAVRTCPQTLEHGGRELASRELVSLGFRPLPLGAGGQRAGEAEAVEHLTDSLPVTLQHPQLVGQLGVGRAQRLEIGRLACGVPFDVLGKEVCR